MRPKKEHYRHKLPHYQQPGQWYSVTCSLYGAMPKGALEKYSSRLETAKKHLQNCESEFRESEFPNSDLGKPKSQLQKAQQEYFIALRKYRLAYDKILNQSRNHSISLVKNCNLKIIEEALLFWEGKRLNSHAWCIMPNHLHWVLSVFEKDEDGNPVYLQDILHSVKLYTARRINSNENHSGQLWEHESFETTIRNQQHFHNVVRYVYLNPVSAGFIDKPENWPGTWISEV